MLFFALLFLLGISGFLPVTKGDAENIGGFESQDLATLISDRIDYKINGYYSQPEPIGYGIHIPNRMKQTLTLMHYIDSLPDNERKDVLDNLRFLEPGSSPNVEKFPDNSEKVQFESG